MLEIRNLSAAQTSLGFYGGKGVSKVGSRSRQTCDKGGKHFRSAQSKRTNFSRNQCSLPKATSSQATSNQPTSQPPSHPATNPPATHHPPTTPPAPGGGSVSYVANGIRTGVSLRFRPPGYDFASNLASIEAGIRKKRTKRNLRTYCFLRAGGSKRTKKTCHCDSPE